MSALAAGQAAEPDGGRWPRWGLAWLVWRQHRVAAAGVLALFGVAAGLLLAVGLPMHATYRNLGLPTCGPQAAPRCAALLQTFADRYYAWGLYLPRLLMFLPALVGAFVGAPLVAREFETGTFRFAWTQGRGRSRWLVAKLGSLALLSTLAALGLSLLFGWWFGPFEPILGRISSGAFEVAGVVFAARTLFGLALGALAGALIRRTVPAMAAALAGWLAVVVPTALLWRPHYRAALAGPVDEASPFDTNWALHSWWLDPAGHRLDAGTLNALERQLAGRGLLPGEWLRQHHYVLWESFQPDSRFWTFQAIEAGWLCALAVALAAATVWWVRRAS